MVTNQSILNMLCGQLWVLGAARMAGLLPKHSWRTCILYRVDAIFPSFLLLLLLCLSIFTTIAVIDCVSHRRHSLRAVTVTDCMEMDMEMDMEDGPGRWPWEMDLIKMEI